MRGKHDGLTTFLPFVITHLQAVRYDMKTGTLGCFKAAGKHPVLFLLLFRAQTCLPHSTHCSQFPILMNEESITQSMHTSVPTCTTWTVNAYNNQTIYCLLFAQVLQKSFFYSHIRSNRKFQWHIGLCTVTFAFVSPSQVYWEVLTPLESGCGLMWVLITVTNILPWMNSNVSILRKTLL